MCVNEEYLVDVDSMKSSMMPEGWRFICCTRSWRMLSGWSKLEMYHMESEEQQR